MCFLALAYPWRELIAPNNIPNLCLAVVGSITAWLAFKTLVSIKKQLTIAHASLVSASRPKLIVRRMGLALIPKSTKSHEYVNQVPWRIELTITNIGATTAHVRGSSIEILWFIPRRDYKDTVVKLPIGNRCIKPGESQTNEFLIDGNDDERMKFLARMVTNERDPIESLRCVCLIQYSDDIGVARTTQIDRCYDWNSCRFLPSTDPDCEFTD